MLKPLVHRSGWVMRCDAKRWVTRLANSPPTDHYYHTIYCPLHLHLSLIQTTKQYAFNVDKIVIIKIWGRPWTLMVTKWEICFALHHFSVRRATYAMHTAQHSTSHLPWTRRFVPVEKLKINFSICQRNGDGHYCVATGNALPSFHSEMWADEIDRYMTE